MNILYADEIYLSWQINFLSNKQKIKKKGLNNEKEISHCANTR